MEKNVWSQCLWPWHACWYQMGWLEYFSNCWSPEIFLGEQSVRVYTKRRARVNSVGGKAFLIREVRGEWPGKWAFRKATLDQITAHCTHSEQWKGAEDHTGFRPLSAIYRKLKLQWAQAVPNWTFGVLKKWLCYFLMNINFCRDIGRRWLGQNLQDNPWTLPALCQAVHGSGGGCVMAWGKFSWLQLSSVILICVLLHLSIVDDHMHAIILSCHGCAVSQSHRKAVSWTGHWVPVAFPVSVSESSRTLSGRDRTGDSQLEYTADKSAAIMWGNHVNMNPDACHEEIVVLSPTQYLIVLNV